MQGNAVQLVFLQLIFEIPKIFLFRDFCFHLMSFGVVSIALDRLRTVYGLVRMERTGRMPRSSRQFRFVKVCVPGEGFPLACTH